MRRYNEVDLSVTDYAMGSGGQNVSSHHYDPRRDRTHASTGGLGRAVISKAGDGGRSETLIVDANVAAAVEWRRAVDLVGGLLRTSVELAETREQPVRKGVG